MGEGLEHLLDLIPPVTATGDTWRSKTKLKWLHGTIRFPGGSRNVSNQSGK